jgi:DNA-binding IclR family transcriptional regulator
LTCSGGGLILVPLIEGYYPAARDDVPEPRSTEPVEAIHRAIRILDAFTLDAPELGVADLSRRLGLKRSTVHRALTTLEAGGLLRQTASTQKYSLGPKLLSLALVAESHLSLAKFALPGMEALRNLCKETVALHLLEGLGRTVIQQVEGTHDLRRTYLSLGRLLPLHAGSPGKLLLAFLPAEQAGKVLYEAPLTAYTPNTVVDREALAAELDVIRRQGYAISSSEHSHGITSISCPVRNRQAGVIAAINVSGPSSRFTEAVALEYLPALRDLADSVSRQLGYLGPLDGA